MLKNHWGVTVDSDKPITGVLNTNSIAFEWLSDEICLTCEEIEEETPEDEWEFIECSSDHTRFLGDWLKDDEGKYYPDPAGEFAAIEGEIYTQVVFSKVTKRVALCSPCYPGQGDLDSEGEFLAYTLPAELLND
jgi:hypothetical protein